MAIVQSIGSLQAVQRLADPPADMWRSSSSLALSYAHDPAVYAALYRTQPNVRTVVDFIARNVAQLGIHIFRRVSDTDRVRLVDHQLADWLTHPTPYVTRYRLVESTMQDLGVHFNAYWLKVRQGDRIGLQRVPPEQMVAVGGLIPRFYRWTTETAAILDFPVSEVAHFSGYNPASPLMGLSPLETLRRLLAEDAAAMEHRESFWENAARIEGVIERRSGGKPWSPAQVDDFRAQWHAKFSGAAGSGSVPVLQDGDTFKPIAFSPRQAEYVSARKLTREEVAAAYHVPLPMVGILEHATFSNIKEQHKHLYQDCLGPWLSMLTEEIERQILPECRDVDRVYVEFNISEKLSGSFEEQGDALRQLVGAPVMTRNEGRARLNLPASDDPDADRLVRPLNTTTESSAPSLPPPALPDENALAIAPVIEATWARQAAVLGKAAAADRLAAFDDDEPRWTRELVADLEPLYRAAGCDEWTATRRAVRLAGIVNGDTRTMLAAGVAAFGRQREGTDYVP